MGDLQWQTKMLPNNKKIRFVKAWFACLSACIAGCGGGEVGGASQEVAPSSATSTSSATTRAIALSRQTSPTGFLAAGQGSAVALVHALQARWTPALHDTAMVFATWPFLPGPLDAVSWRALPSEQPPAEYGGVLSSGMQTVGRVYRCELAFDAKYAGDRSSVFVPVPELDVLTNAQRLALSVDQFTARLLGAVSTNRYAIRGVFQRPAELVVGDSVVSVMQECDNRKYGSDLPPEGQLSVATGRVESTLLDISSTGDQVVSSTFSLVTKTVGRGETAISGAFLGSFIRRFLASVVRDDVRVVIAANMLSRDADFLLYQAEVLAPLPSATGSGAVPAPTLRVRYDKWKVAEATGRAVDGSITITDGSGNSARIQPNGSSYMVQLKAGSSDSTYTVDP